MVALRNEAGELIAYYEKHEYRNQENKVLLVAFKKNESGNGFWESQGFTLREDLNYRNKALAEMIRIDPDYLKQ